MEAKFLPAFLRDVKKLPNSEVKEDVKAAIKNVEAAKTLAEIKNLEKLKGHKNAYRIRIRTYRIGVYIVSDVITFACVVSRREIYDAFP